MIVDLERNDLGRVCEPGSVAWPELMTPRSMAGVEHLVSRVTGRVRAGMTLPELLAAMFPGGSVTGAPKIAALDQIAAIEPVGRGASMGALGVIHPNGDFDLALTIRTFAIVGRRHPPVGRRRHRVGFRPGRRGGGVVGQGSTAAGCPRGRRGAASAAPG